MCVCVYVKAQTCVFDPRPVIFFKDVWALVLRQRVTAPFRQTDSVRQRWDNSWPQQTIPALYLRVCMFVGDRECVNKETVRFSWPCAPTWQRKTEIEGRCWYSDYCSDKINCYNPASFPVWQTVCTTVKDVEEALCLLPSVCVCVWERQGEMAESE